MVFLPGLCQSCQLSGCSFCLLSFNDVFSHSGNTFGNHPLFAFAASRMLVNKYKSNAWRNGFHRPMCQIPFVRKGFHVGSWVPSLQLATIYANPQCFGHPLRHRSLHKLSDAQCCVAVLLLGASGDGAGRKERGGFFSMKTIKKNSFRNFIFLVGYLWLIKGNQHSHTLSKLQKYGFNGNKCQYF